MAQAHLLVVDDVLLKSIAHELLSMNMDNMDDRPINPIQYLVSAFLSGGSY